MKTPTGTDTQRQQTGAPKSFIVGVLGMTGEKHTPFNSRRLSSTGRSTRRVCEDSQQQKSTMAPAFMGGSLSFKGDKKSKKKKKKKATKKLVETKHSLESTMTQAEQKAHKRKQERERIELEKAAQKSHRERVEEFNEKLGNETELNDIPRVSAAGNG